MLSFFKNLRQLRAEVEHLKTEVYELRLALAGKQAVIEKQEKVFREIVKLAEGW